MSDESVLEKASGSASQGQEHTISTQQKHIPFTLLSRDAQLQAFLAWLPPEIHNAPGIDWTLLSDRLLGYFVNTVRDSPDGLYVALVCASAAGGMGQESLLRATGQVHLFLCTLRKMGLLQHVSDLKQEQVWKTFVEKTEMTQVRYRQLQAYSTLSAYHFPGYLQRLDVAERSRMQGYALPHMPHGFLKQHGGRDMIRSAGQAHRRAQSDTLVPLYPVLRQLVRLRKQLAERMLETIREARQRVEDGVATLPLPFQHTDVFPFVNRDARAVSEVEIRGREVTMHFVLWDKRSWVLHHQNQFGVSTVQHAKAGTYSYSQEHHLFLVQFVGPPEDFLWFGDILQQRLFQRFTQHSSPSEEYHRRWQLAKALGFPEGCVCSRPGILDSADHWFSFCEHDGDFLFEPEAIYRGVLFGATLATIALTNGSRVSELLQVSWNPERRITRTEMVKMLDDEGKPAFGPDGQPMMRQVKIHLQHLLPKGGKTDEERQLFPLSKEALRLMGEVKRALEEAYGEIPVVHPTRSSAKYEDLKPERYFFQWDSTQDGRLGIFLVSDVQVLLRFMLHGLNLFTAQGKPIRVSAHLLRHVMATDARQYRHVPPEAIAHFFLHHRLKTLKSPFATTSVVTDYYFQMTEAQRLTIIREYLDEQEEHDLALVNTSPTTRDLEQMNEDLQVVYEQWHSLHPTAFGYCGCPGLCPRGYNRSLCIGCSFLVTDPSRLGAAKAWRAAYTQQAEALELQGAFADARQVRILVQQLDDLINVMHLQVQTEADGRYIPVFKALPRPQEEVSDE